MRVAVFTRSFHTGGAGRAAERITDAIERFSQGTISFEWHSSDGASIADHGHLGNQPGMVLHFRRLVTKAIRVVFRLVAGFGHRPPSDYCLVPSGRGKLLSASSADLVHLHWVGDGDLSLKEIGELQRPVVWTMHDMWVFLGSERFTLTDSFTRGYPRTDTGRVGRQFVNRFILERKMRTWSHPMTLVAPSSWLAAKAKQSPATTSWPIHVIPNALDTDLWSPGSSRDAREELGLPTDTWLVVFGAVDPMGNHNKGADLVREALQYLRGMLSRTEAENVHIAVFGESKVTPAFEGFETHSLGSLDEAKMRCVYRSANVVVVPSRLENLPQVATEAAACATPVVAFNTSGVPDVVIEGETGLLAPPYDTEALAMHIHRLYADPGLASGLGDAARERAVRLWSNEVVAKQYEELYLSLVKD